MVLQRAKRSALQTSLICTRLTIFLLLWSAPALAQQPSPDGSQIPPASAIIDTVGDTWTISGVYVLRNGVWESTGHSERLLYYGGQIYSYWVGQWWKFIGNGWRSVGATTPGNVTIALQSTPSPNGTQVPPSSQIIDASGNAWTISGVYALRNGVWESNGHSERLLYYGGEIYSYWVSQWWKFIGNGWLSVGATIPGTITVAPDSTTGGSLTLMWDPAVESEVQGYIVYVGTAPGEHASSYDVGNALSFVYRDAAADQPYYFSVASYLPGPVIGPPSSEVVGYSNASPSLQNPGNQSSTVGQFVSLQLAGSDPYGEPLFYTASGLPPGLTIMNSTGLVSGTPTAAGTYSVTATASDGVLTATQMFTWVVVALPTDVTAPIVTITSPTSDSRFTSRTEYMTLGGTAVDDVDVTEVRWSSDRGWSGRATGTTVWIAGVPLKSGWNTITIEARDGAGNVGRRTVKVRGR